MKSIRLYNSATDAISDDNKLNSTPFVGMATGGKVVYASLAKYGNRVKNVTDNADYFKIDVAAAMMFKLASDSAYKYFAAYTPSSNGGNILNASGIYSNFDLSAGVIVFPYAGYATRNSSLDSTGYYGYDTTYINPSALDNLNIDIFANGLYINIDPATASDGYIYGAVTTITFYYKNDSGEFVEVTTSDSALAGYSNAALILNSTFLAGKTHLIYDGQEIDLTEAPDNLLVNPVKGTTFDTIELPYGFKSLSNTFNEIVVKNVVLPCDLEILVTGSFNLCGLTTLTLPSSLTNINDNAIVLPTLTSLIYQGTCDQWHQVVKQYGWISYGNVTSVTCIDGSVDIEFNETNTAVAEGSEE